jgi:hypothetical protein
MSADDYYTMAWTTLQDKRQSLLSKRTELETDLHDVAKEISHLDEILSHLSPLAGIVDDPANIAGLGITDAIRVTLQSVNERMSAVDIRKKLGENGFDLSGYSQPMASIYKILARLREAEEIDVEKEGYKTFYSWKRKNVEVADDDIPF